ncbi:MAG: nucleotidyl transferase AbiEii/AbiGii toxin family protein [Patescibacteria group bacterium]|nr:nucleotidyl transferase AbiEii/AbiGii toxin family protein [Patescibacteria group bacterium]
MGRILKDIYSDIEIASLLGFKGGTSAYFFYNLPRLSVDLDFDLIAPLITDEIKNEVYKKTEKILKKYGEIKNQYIKRNTIFFILSYGDDEHNIKIEISTRTLPLKTNELFEIKELFGISMFVANKKYLLAGKLVALTGRANLAARDIYDIHCFLSNDWEIDQVVLEKLTGEKTKKYLGKCIRIIEGLKDNQILHGLGELISAEEKNWIKKNLKSETVFLLKNYLSVIS